MLTIKGRYEKGIIQPLEQIEGHEGQEVTITFDRELDESATMRDLGWDALTKLIDECQVDTGIVDLAHQHDHYLYGTPKREE